MPRSLEKNSRSSDLPPKCQEGSRAEARNITTALSHDEDQHLVHNSFGLHKTEENENENMGDSSFSSKALINFSVTAIDRQ